MRLFVLLIGLFALSNHLNGQVLNDEFLQQLNRLRSTGCECGQATGPLTFNPILASSARSFAKDMVDYDYFSHSDRRGGDVADRIDASGYKWLLVGENLGINQESVEEILYDWKMSLSHCKMMMDARFTEAGIARYGHIWVLHLGLPNEED